MPTRRGAGSKKEQEIESVLESIKAKLLEKFPQLTIGIRVHQNSDDSIDGELKVESIPRGMQFREIILQAEAGATPTEGVFISNGFRFQKDASFPELNSYDRWQRLFQVQTYYQESSKQAINFVTAKDVLENLKEADRRKPEQYFIRYHWNPKGLRPERGNPRKYRYVGSKPKKARRKKK